MSERDWMVDLWVKVEDGTYARASRGRFIEAIGVSRPAEQDGRCSDTTEVNTSELRLST